ncbi:MAG: sugar phosphate isomerase/epimerase [Clostridia bacterium]|nr:sugar phosphate isomerase/epimerase [Clostridia bacterium]
MYPVGISCGAPICEELFQQLREGGIERIEVSLRLDPSLALDFEELKRLSLAYGVELWSFHLPFSPFAQIDPSRPDLTEDTLALHKLLIQRGTAVGITRYVVHASGEPIADDERSARMDCAKRNLAALAAFAAERGAVVAVEDLPRTCLGRNSEEILELLDAHPALRVCLDTNHLLSESLTDFIGRVGDKIITTHVSDYDFVDERHWLPGEGLVDWPAVVEALKKANYQGAWIYELGLKCPKTLSRERDLEYADFGRNAAEIFEGRPITKLGTPLPKE